MFEPDYGCVGGDGDFGRSAIEDLLLNTARFDEVGRQRLTVHLPIKAITFRLDGVERHLGKGGAPF
jgi:hypothetical protein